MTIYYISPTGAGSHSGSSMNDAATINDLPKLIAAASGGDEIQLLADQGDYKVTKEIAIAAGGDAGAPISIRGVSGSGEAMKATFVGTRATDWTQGQWEGPELFRLLSGADHLRFSDLATKDFGNGVFRVGADIQDLGIARVDASNVTRFIENHVSGAETSASVNGLTVSDVTVSGYSQDAIRLKYDGSNITLQNIVGDSMRQDGDLYRHGVSLEGTVHDVLLDRVTMNNNYGQGSSSEYWNGDGFVTEGDTYNLIFQDTSASGNTDAGYDIKSDHVTMIRAQASGNTKNFRFWGSDVRVVDSVSSDPQWFGGIGNPTHVHGPGDGGSVTLENFRYSDSSDAKVFDLSDGANSIKLVNTSMPVASDIHTGSGSTVSPANPGDVISKGADNGWLTGATQGQALEASRLQQLVQEMASFTTSSATSASLAGSQQTGMEPVIAANAQNT